MTIQKPVGNISNNVSLYKEEVLEAYLKGDESGTITIKRGSTSRTASNAISMQ